MKQRLKERSKILQTVEYRTPRRRRERHDIIMEILETAKKGVVKTRILTAVGLSHIQLKNYLSELKEAGFLSEEASIWKTTKKGLSVIDACKICQDLTKKTRKT